MTGSYDLYCHKLGDIVMPVGFEGDIFVLIEDHNHYFLAKACDKDYTLTLGSAGLVDAKVNLQRWVNKHK